MSKKIVNVYLFTKDCQHVFLKKPLSRYGLYRQIERKLTQISHQVIKDNLSATVQANLIFKNLNRLMDDLQSEITKYESLIQNNLIKDEVKTLLRAVCFPCVNPTRLTQLCNESLRLVDRLIVLLLKAKNVHLFDSERAFLSVKSAVMAKFFYVLSKINRISIKQFPTLTVKQYLASPNDYPAQDFNKIQAILCFGFVPKYAGGSE